MNTPNDKTGPASGAASDDLTSLAADDDAKPPAVEGGTISGAVTDFEAVPLVGVRVEVATSGGADLDLLPVLTDGDGRFTLTGLAADVSW